MWLTELWHRWQDRPATGRRHRPAPHRRRARPALEALEDRTVPSTFAVTSTGDDVTDHHTLRYATVNAQDGDTILLTPALGGAPIVLTNGELVLPHDVTITTVNNAVVTLISSGSDRIFEPFGLHINMENLVITGGRSINSGGGILNHGTLSITNCTLAGNSAADGGAIYNTRSGTLTLSGCTLSNNTAYGGGAGIYNAAGTLTLSGCTLSGNSAFGFGGAVNNTSRFIDNTLVNGMATISGCVLSGNSAMFGGGVSNDGVMTLRHCTLSANSAVFDGGGILNDGPLSVSNCSFIGNSAGRDGGGIYNSNPPPEMSMPVTVSDSILSGNSAGGVGGGIVASSQVEVGNTAFCMNSPDNIFGLYFDQGGNTFC